MISTELLRRFPHFSGIPDEYMKAIAEISRIKSFEPGEELFREGNGAIYFMLLLTGEIHVVYQIGDGSKFIADTLVAGDPLAWSALLEPHTLTASGIAHKPGALIEIEAGELRRMCEENKDFGFTMMKEVAKVLRTRLSAMRVQAVTRHPELA